LLDLTLLDPKLHQIVQDMQEGEISDVITEKDRAGNDMYKILMVKKRIPTHKINYEEDYPKVKEMALAQKKEKVLVEWMNDKIKNNYVKINPEFMQCDFDSNWKKND